jgi:hypothetical protein
MRRIEDMRMISRYENEILEVIENQMSTDGRDLPWSDVQGRVGAIVMNLIDEVRAARQVCRVCKKLMHDGNICQTCSDSLPF